MRKAGDLARGRSAAFTGERSARRSDTGFITLGKRGESMNIPDRVNDFLVDVRNHGGFANDKDFDRVAAEVFKRQIKELIEECAKICDRTEEDRRLLGQTDGALTAKIIGSNIRDLDS
jgi:hypothetical protein